MIVMYRAKPLTSNMIKGLCSLPFEVSRVNSRNSIVASKTIQVVCNGFVLWCRNLMNLNEDRIAVMRFVCNKM
jgi:hypothetical protein